MNLTNLRNAVQIAEELRDAIDELTRTERTTVSIGSALCGAKDAHAHLRYLLHDEEQRRVQSLKQEVSS